jgi:NAD+ diphosphatase
VYHLPDLRSPIDRAPEIRDDEKELANRLSHGKIIFFSAGAYALNQGENIELAAFHGHQVMIAESDELIYLGRYEGEDYFLLAKKEADQNNLIWKNLREIGEFLPLDQYFLALQGQALANWHFANPFCHYCGGKTKSAKGGAIRICITEERELFPRTDPAIITLLYDEADRILLGRQKVWVENRYSNFAGFVEAAESFEETVQREAKEEAGVDVVDIEYLGSQAWPFPQSLMIAFSARVLDPASAKADGEEIEDLRWYTKSELVNDLKSGRLSLPPKMSVSRKMIEAWYGSEL